MIKCCIASLVAISFVLGMGGCGDASSSGPSAPPRKVDSSTPPRKAPGMDTSTKDGEPPAPKTK
jgi:hypothetical protein